MKRKWIAVVTRTEARVFAGKEFTVVTKLKNSLGRLKNRARLTGKPGFGRGGFSKGTAFHSLTGEKDPHEEAAVKFSKRVADYLQKEMNLAKFDKLVLVAEPKMLGRVKSHMNERLLARVEIEAKDFGKLSVHELKKVVRV